MDGDAETNTRLRIVARRTVNLLTMDYCPIFVRWNPFRRPTPTQRIRRQASRHQFAPYPLPLRLAARMLHVVLWPVQAALHTGRMVRRFGPVVAARTGKGRMRQAAEQYGLALSAFVPPKAYYQYGLYEPHRRAHAAAYLHNHETACLSRLLNDPACVELLADKQRFAEVCRQHDLPAVPTLAVVDAVSTALSLPEVDLFVKPVRGARGEGVQRLRRYAGGWVWHDGAVLAAPALAKMLRRQAGVGSLLVQPALDNHPALADLSSGGLATLRFVTARRPDGRMEPLAATFKMPWRGALTSTHGLGSAVDLDTGRLGCAYPYRPAHPGFDIHPDVGARITERVLPGWSEVVGLVERAHAAFSGCVLIGWDVAFTASGPLLLEGNAGWDVVMVQQPQRCPLGQTSLVPLLLAHLDA